MNAKRVLIVDDALDIGRMISAALTTLDPTLQSKVMPTAEEAIMDMFQDTPDLLVIDIRLPGISGLDLTRKVRAQHPNVKIIQISGVNDPQAKPKALEAGADAFFPKPLSMSEFLNAVSRYLGMAPASPAEAVVLEKPSEDQTARLADILTGLRRSVGAAAAGLVNERGRVMLQIGNLSDPSVEGVLVPALMNALSAGEKVSRQLGTTPGGFVYTFRGTASHLLAAPVGGAGAVIVLLKPEKSELRMAIALEEMLSAQAELQRFFKSTEKPAQPPPEPVRPAAAPVEKVIQPAAPPVQKVIQPAVPPVEKVTQPTAPPVEMVIKPAAPPVKAVVQPDAPIPPVGPAEKAEVETLETLIRASARRRLKRDEIDAFWDELVDRPGSENASGPASPDMLSYDQADRLGLVPKDPDPG